MQLIHLRLQNSVNKNMAVKTVRYWHAINAVRFWQ